MTPLFGTPQPPSGVSEMLRRAAFKFSESDLRHWMILLFADRVNMVEGLGSDLMRGHVSNLFAEMGGRAKFKHNREAAVQKAVVVSAVAALSLLLWQRSRNRQTDALDYRQQTGSRADAHRIDIDGACAGASAAHPIAACFKVKVVAVHRVVVRAENARKKPASAFMRFGQHLGLRLSRRSWSLRRRSLAIYPVLAHRDTRSALERECGNVQRIGRRMTAAKAIRGLRPLGRQSFTAVDVAAAITAQVLDSDHTLTKMALRGGLKRMPFPHEKAQGHRATERQYRADAHTCSAQPHRIGKTTARSGDAVGQQVVSHACLGKCSQATSRIAARPRQFVIG